MLLKSSMDFVSSPPLSEATGYHASALDTVTVSSAETDHAVRAANSALEQDDAFAVSSGALVMMVDDEPLMLEMVQCFLEDAGYQNFVTTSEPADAMRLLTEHRPDILLLDLSMPRVSGFDVLAQVRAHEELRYTPVIILTAEGGSEAKLRALKLGATDFLTKPVDSSELQLRLRNALAFKSYQDRLADYDALTGLPNRRKFAADVTATLSSVRDRSHGCALLHIDVDRFKQINDTLGQRVGDKVLCALSQRIAQILDAEQSLSRARNTQAQRSLSFARIGGNGFALLMSNLHNLEKVDVAGNLARRVLHAIHDAVVVDDHELFLTASVGLAVSPADGGDAETLMRHAEMAMYQGKKRGGDCFEFYSREMNARARERVTLENQLRRAVERDEFVLFYQPKVNIASGRITAVEALIRWKHPELGVVSPGKFIPVAEETGLIVEIGQWVLRTACAQAKAWSDQGLPPLTMSVNVSGAQFKQGKVWHAVSGALAHSRLPAQQLILELTESLLMENAADSIEALHDIKEMGCKLSVDDFGTGYSSLTYLSDFPLDELKIDRSFVSRLGAERNSQAITGAIVALAKELNLITVAEGVETNQQLQFLESRGCDMYQGYLCTRPAPAELIARLVRRGNIDRRGEPRTPAPTQD
jgi:diguanylate cyclase (GGDEF)-like protein